MFTKKVGLGAIWLHIAKKKYMLMLPLMPFFENKLYMLRNNKKRYGISVEYLIKDSIIGAKLEDFVLLRFVMDHIWSYVAFC